MPDRTNNQHQVVANVVPGPGYTTTDIEVGEYSRHWLQWRAEQVAAAANDSRLVPTVEYRAVRRDGRWLVIAYQNRAVPR